MKNAVADLEPLQAARRTLYSFPVSTIEMILNFDEVVHPNFKLSFEVLQVKFL